MLWFLNPANLPSVYMKIWIILMNNLSSATIRESKEDIAKNIIIVKEAQEKWRATFAKDKTVLKDFLKLREGEKPFAEVTGELCGTGEQKIRDFGFSKVPGKECTVVEVPNSTCSVASFTCIAQSTPNMASASNDKSGYSKYAHIELAKWLINHLCPNNKILTDDVLSNEDFMSVIGNVALSYNVYHNFYYKYVSQQSRKRTTNLTQSLKCIENFEADIKCLLIKASKIHLATTLGTAVLAESSLAKNKLLTKATEHMLILKGCLSKSLMNNLRHRIKQQAVCISRAVYPTQLDKLQFRCMNSSSLTWSDSFKLIHEKENAGESTLNPLLSTYELLDVGQLLEEQLFIDLVDIAVLFNIGCNQHAHLDQLLILFPVMTIASDSFVVLANLHEFIMYPGALARLLEIHSTPSPEPIADLLTAQPHPASTAQPHPSIAQPHPLPKSSTMTQKNKCGHPSLVSQFPSLVDVVAECIKQHGIELMSAVILGL